MKQKVAIITGASSGIGKKAAEYLAKQNISVMLAARREDELLRLQKKIIEIGGIASLHVADVTSYNQMKMLAEDTIRKYGKIDFLINSAGIMDVSFFNDLRVEEWNKMIDVNIKGTLHGIAAVLPHMESQNEGHIINISSVAGYEVTVPRSVYSATKFAIRAITEGLRKELKPEQNIRTTLIAPGAVTTDLLKDLPDSEALQMIKQEGSFAYSLTTEDISKAILYAIRQPIAVSINEVIVRPTAQRR